MRKVHEQKVDGKRTSARRVGKRNDLTGRRFERWTVLGMRWEDGKGLAWCKCDCGTIREVVAATLSYGSSTSCGCLAIERSTAITRTHGASRSRLYGNWCDMRRRCNDPSREDYYLYGGRGVYVCDGWQAFEAFRDDVGERPGRGWSLDRIDPNQSYTCGRCAQCVERRSSLNVRWATASEQARNKRDAVMVTFRGQTRHIMEWAEITGIGYNTLHSRIHRRKWSPEDALTIEPAHGNNQLTRRSNE